MVTRTRWRSALVRRWNGPRALRGPMLSLAEFMGQDGSLCVPRADLAAYLEVSERTIDRYYKDATELGWLEQVRSGRHRTAMYQARIPSPFRVIEGGRADSPKRDTAGAYHPDETRQTPTHNQVAETRHLLSHSYIEGERSERVAVDLPVRSGNGVLLVLRRDHRTQPARVLGGELRQSKAEAHTHADHAHDSGPLLADFDLGLRLTAPHEAGLLFAREVS